MPGTTDVLMLAMAGYGTGHVWRGTRSGGGWTWSDLSGTPPNRLPDAPVNALQVDPTDSNTMYVGTSVTNRGRMIVATSEHMIRPLNGMRNRESP